jgi:phosphatidylinositol alpha-mannosyltransferase
MGKLKVGFVLDDTLDTPDGVQQYILTLGGWLAAEGHEVHYLVGSTKRTDIPNVHALSRNMKVQFNGNRMSTPLPAGRRAIRELLQREKFDVLHVQIPYSPFMAQRVIHAAPSSTAIIGTFHIAPNSRSVDLANKLLSRLVRRSLKRFDAILSVSQAAADFARQTYGIESTVMPNVVRAAQFKQAEAFPADGSRPTIVFLGRLVPRKGCQILLEALTLLEADTGLPKPRVIVCGRGPLEADLKAYTAANKLTDRVEFAGFVDDGVKARYLKTADIAVFPSTGGESFGIVLIEAMAAEHPVVLGADNAGYTTVLGPHPDSLFPVFNAPALAGKLRTFLADSTLRQETLGWQKVYVRQFDVAVVGRRIVARYDEVLRRKQAT